MKNNKLQFVIGFTLKRGLNIMMLNEHQKFVIQNHFSKIKYNGLIYYVNAINASFEDVYNIASVSIESISDIVDASLFVALTYKDEIMDMKKISDVY